MQRPVHAQGPLGHREGNGTLGHLNVHSISVPALLGDGATGQTCKVLRTSDIRMDLRVSWTLDAAAHGCPTTLTLFPGVLPGLGSASGRRGLAGRVRCAPDAGWLCLLFPLEPPGLQSSLEGINASKLTNDSFFTSPGAKGTGHRGPLRSALIPVNSTPGLARHSAAARLGTIACVPALSHPLCPQT